MKFLDLVTFVPINEWLSDMECGGHVITGRIEAYSCKKTSSDRKLYKSLQMSGTFSRSEEAANVAFAGHLSEPDIYIPTPVTGPAPSLSLPTATNPPFAMPGEPLATIPQQQQQQQAATAGGDENSTFAHLVATLNAAMPDYDFSSAPCSHFTRVTVYEMMNHVKTALEGAQHLERPVPLADLWRALEQEAQLGQCEAFTYRPPPDSDPFLEDGAIWALNFIMYNRSIRRTVLLTLTCERPHPASSAGVMPSPAATPSLPLSIAARTAQADSPTPYDQAVPFGYHV